MIVKQIRLSNQAKDKLSRLKGKTGIKNWNIWKLLRMNLQQTYRMIQHQKLEMKQQMV